MIRTGWARNNVNRQIGRLKHLFKWAVENEIVPSGVFEAIRTVTGLRRGRTPARETEPAKPVPEAYVEAALPFLSVQIVAMIELQRITGMRPGEVCATRGIYLDTAGRRWVYTPARHKTQHHGLTRTVNLGPRAQAVLRPFLRPVLGEYIFSPADAEKARRDSLTAIRKTPTCWGNKPGTNRETRPQRVTGDQYVSASYAKAISRACDRADEHAKAGVVVGNEERLVPRWSPNQLRHNAATWLRKEFGLEAAQVILGHKTLTVTQVYAEKNVEAAQRIMDQVG